MPKDTIILTVNLQKKYARLIEEISENKNCNKTEAIHYIFRVF